MEKLSLKREQLSMKYFRIIPPFMVNKGGRGLLGSMLMFVSNEDNVSLQYPFSKEYDQRFYGGKSSGTGWLNYGIFKKCWNIVHFDLPNAFVRSLNATFNPSLHLSQKRLELSVSFQAHQACGSFYKILSKVQAGRLKKATGNLSPLINQASLKVDKLLMPQSFLMNVWTPG